MSKDGVRGPIVDINDVKSGRVRIPTPKENIAARCADREAAERAELEAKREVAKAVKAAEDKTRRYSPLVQRVKDRYDQLFMSEGQFLNVYAAISAHEGIAIYAMDEANRDEVRLGALIVSLELDKPFSEQWPQKLDNLTPEIAHELAPKGVLAPGSAHMVHVTELGFRSGTTGTPAQKDVRQIHDKTRRAIIALHADTTTTADGPG